ncbi:unnamed protein product [Toxocara canis]|uniref:DUF659 domain-containing protein n=1 Tax=Toxocara canis TaxID=6265 RepID=A0A183UBN5_TOXCA|nr:unnamed protein product [Toxocara canis]
MQSKKRAIAVKTATDSDTNRADGTSSMASFSQTASCNNARKRKAGKPHGGSATNDSQKMTRCHVERCAKEFAYGRDQHSVLRNVRTKHNNRSSSEKINSSREGNNHLAQPLLSPQQMLIAFNRSDMLMPLVITPAPVGEDGEARCYAWTRVRYSWHRIHPHREAKYMERYKCVGCSRVFQRPGKRFNVDSSVPCYKKEERTEDPVLKQSPLSTKVRECLSNEVAGLDSIIEVAVDDDLRFVKCVRANWDAICVNVDSEDCWRVISDTYIDNGWEWRSKHLPRERWENIIKGVEAKRKSFVPMKDFSKCERIAELIMRRSTNEATRVPSIKTKRPLADLLADIRNNDTTKETSCKEDDDLLQISIPNKFYHRNRVRDALFMQLVRAEWPTLSTANICDEEGRAQLRAAWTRVDNAQRAKLGLSGVSASIYWNHICAVFMDEMKIRCWRGESWVPDEAEAIFAQLLHNDPGAVRIRSRHMLDEDLRMLLDYLLQNHIDFMQRKWLTKELQTVFDQIADKLPMKACTREQLLDPHIGYSILTSFIHKTMERWNRYGGDSFLLLFGNNERIALQLCGVNVPLIHNDIKSDEHKLNAFAVAEDDVRFVRLVRQLRNSHLLYFPLRKSWQIVVDVYRANGWQWMWRYSPIRRWHCAVLNVKRKKKARDEQGQNWVMSESESIIMDELHDEAELTERMQLDRTFSAKLMRMMADLQRSIPSFCELDEEDRKEKLEITAFHAGLDDAASEIVVEDSTRLFNALLSPIKRGLTTGRLVTDLENAVQELDDVGINGLTAKQAIISSLDQEITESVVNEGRPRENDISPSSSMELAREGSFMDSKSGLMAEFFGMKGNSSPSIAVSSDDENYFEEDMNSPAHDEFDVLSDDPGCKCEVSTGEGWTALEPKGKLHSEFINVDDT